MTQMNSEKDARERVRHLREFYKHLVIYGLGNFACILIWAISGGGYFWPIWVMLGWGIGLTMQAISLDLIPVLTEMLPFLNPNWEDQQVKKLMKEDKKDKPTKK